ncbi:UV excision repair protein Rad23 [Trametopsis cervina]|nr:UV excision repair protein Rad23 [Trametopsis cervina]
MKITVKTLQQKVFQLDAEDSDTVADLKKKIQETQGHPAEAQRLIFSGKVLSDDKTVASCEIKEKDFLVLTVTKPKPAPKAAAPTVPAPSTSAAAAPSTPAAPPSTSTPAASNPQPPNAPVLTPAQPATVDSTAAVDQRDVQDGNAFVTGSALQTSVQNMIEMGFEREQVMRALRASFNNPERAVEYLFSGIPAGLEAVAQGAAPPAAAAAAAAPAAPVSTPVAIPAPAVAPAAQPAAAAPRTGQNQNLFQLAQQQQAQPQQAAGAGGALDVQAIANQPQIQQLRQMMQQNPELVQPILEDLARQNPQLAQLFAQHPEMLAQILGLNPEDVGIPEGEDQGVVVHITPEEAEAIQRLEGLGFPRQAAIEAYFACDKDEAMAANYLFENAFED